MTDILAAIAGFLSPDLIAGAVVGVLTLFSGFLLKLFYNEVRRRNVAIAIRHAYLAVEEIARLDTEKNLIDKAAAGLKAADDWMLAQGWRKLTENEKKIARLEFSAISGEEAARAKVVAQAIQLGGGAAVPSGPRAS